MRRTAMALILGGCMAGASPVLAAPRAADGSEVEGYWRAVAIDEVALRFARAQAPLPPTPARMPPLEGPWRAFDIDGQAIVAGTAVTLRIDARGGSGADGCNYYSARRASSPPDGIRFGGFVSTRMGCEEPRLDQVRRYHALLAKVERYRIDRDGSLALITGTGRMIRFRRDP